MHQKNLEKLMINLIKIINILPKLTNWINTEMLSKIPAVIPYIIESYPILYL